MEELKQLLLTKGNFAVRSSGIARFRIGLNISPIYWTGHLLPAIPANQTALDYCRSNAIRTLLYTGAETTIPGFNKISFVRFDTGEVLQLIVSDEQLTTPPLSTLLTAKDIPVLLENGVLCSADPGYFARTVTLLDMVF